MHTNNEKIAFNQILSRSWNRVFFDDCTDSWQNHWFMDGKVASVINRPDGMMLSAGPQFLNDDHHLVLWTKEEYAGDLKIEFDYTRADFALNCVNIIYIQARGAGEAPYLEDISTWNELRESPSMAMYHDYMNTYHISFATDASGEDDYVRARRYIPCCKEIAQGEGLANTDIAPDYFKSGLFAPGELHHFCIIKMGQELSMRVSNSEKTNYYHWKNTKAPPILEGRIGIRHMNCRSALYHNFEISQPK